MTSFLFKVSLFVVLLLALMAGLFGISMKSYFKSKNVYAKKNILTQKAPSCKNYTLILGNSHAQFAFNTTLLSANGINMAAPSQGMMEDYAILNHAFRLNPAISNVTLAYSYHSNANILYESIRDEEVNRMFEYAYAYNIKYPTSAYTPQKCLKLLSNWAVYVTKRPGARNDLDLWGNTKAPCSPQTYAITGVRERVEQHFNLRTTTQHTANPYFDSIRIFCNQHQIPLTIIIPPYTRSYMNELQKQQPDAYTFIDQLVAQPTKTFTLYDCRNLFQNQEASFFKDPDHLSPCGRDSFSVYLNSIKK